MDKATEKQVKFMKNLGVSEVEAESLSKMAAKEKIDYLLKQREESRPPKVMSEQQFKPTGKSESNGNGMQVGNVMNCATELYKHILKEDKWDSGVFELLAKDLLEISKGLDK